MILKLGNPLLRKKSLKVTDFNEPDFESKIKLLKKALNDFRKDKGFGRGISAIQIGIDKKMTALNLGKETFVILNPEITYFSKEKFVMWDDCMSFPDLLVKVKRSKTINIKYYDEKGSIHEWKNLSQAESELLQHETDHLDGVLALDRAIDSKSIIYRTEYEKNKKFYDLQVDYIISPATRNTNV
jgi:peptide deformylase